MIAITSCFRILANFNTKIAMPYLPSNCRDLKLSALGPHKNYACFDVIEVFFRQGNFLF